MSEQPTPEEKPAEVVVTKDGLFYWVRQQEGKYWPNRGLYFFKYFAVKRARELVAKRVVSDGEVVVWSSHE